MSQRILVSENGKYLWYLHLQVKEFLQSNVVVPFSSLKFIDPSVNFAPVSSADLSPAFGRKEIGLFQWPHSCQVLTCSKS